MLRRADTDFNEVPLGTTWKDSWSFPIGPTHSTENNVSFSYWSTWPALNDYVERARIRSAVPEYSGNKITLFYVSFLNKKFLPSVKFTINSITESKNPLRIFHNLLFSAPIFDLK